jgi:hypothetical protein
LPRFDEFNDYVVMAEYRHLIFAVRATVLILCEVLPTL